MSITGSLVGYENNNDVNNSSSMSKKNRSLLNMSTGSSSKHCASLNSSISNSVITTTSSSVSTSITKHQNNSNKCKQHQHHHKRKRRLHLNALWSIWYGILMTLLQGYLILSGAYRFLGCSLLQWRGGNEPYAELNIQIILCGFVFLILPLFFMSAIFKVGNLANDGIKLATGTGKCSAEPEDGLEAEAKGGTLRALWTHGGPTSAFIHIITALCLLLPQLLLEARLIENGNLQKENIWRTELDFMVTHKDRLVVLSFMTSPYQNTSSPANGHHHRRNRLDEPVDEDETTGGDGDDIIYEKTHLIEKIHTDIDDDGDMFEKLKIELPTTTFTTTTTTAAKTASLGAPTSTKGFVSIPSTAKTATTTTTTTTTSTTENNVKKHKTSTGGSRHTNNAKNNGKKHVGKHHDQRRNQQQPNNKESVEYDDGGGEEDGSGPVVWSDKVIATGGRREKYNRKGADVNEKLELASQANVDFDRIGDFEEVSTVFEPTIRAARPTSPINTMGGGKSMTKFGSGNSDIHIVKPKKPIDTQVGVVGTPATDSKIIEIKPSGGKKVKRFSRTESDGRGDDGSAEMMGGATMELGEATVVIEPAALIGAVPMNNITVTPVELPGIAGCLQRILGVDREMDMTAWSRPPSLEFINFVVAIAVWSARYPAVFWGTSKAFAIVFSCQMVANGVEILLGFAGVSVLYKLQIVGQTMPLQAPALLLNDVVTISLFLLSTVLIISSSLIVYLYGHGRLSAIIRDRRIISTKSGDSWAYFAHCASLCFVLALAVVKAPLMHDLSATYRGSLDGAVLLAALASVMHLLLWIVMWLGLTAKRRWAFKLPPLQIHKAVHQPLLMSPRSGRSATIGGGSGGVGGNHHGGNGHHHQHGGGAEDTIYWPKLTPSSPKLKVTFNEIPSTSSDHDLAEHDGKRNPGRRASLCLSSPPGEADDGDYATLRGPTGDLLHQSELVGIHCDLADDNTSEEGKLLACVRDDSVTYASARDLEPPCTAVLPPPPPPPTPQQQQTLLMETQDLPPPPDTFLVEPLEGIISPMSPVTVTVHTNDVHITASLTPRCLRRADSGVPTDALLTPRSDTTSTESSTSPPDRAPSETSSGVHSGEERDEVLIRPRPAKAVVKPPPPVIQEEPFGRSTNMKMSSFNKEGKSSATLPLNRGSFEPRHEYPNSHCNTMPLPVGCHQQQYRSQVFLPSSLNNRPHQLHTTLPNGIRFAPSHQANFLRRMPHVKNAESPYGILGLGAGHHTFSKLLHDPLCHSIAASVIPEDRDSANYSMISDHDREMYVNAAN